MGVASPGLPDSQAVRKSKTKQLKALVVEADNFALTCRVDAGVIFWPPGFAHVKTPLPPGITHLWVSRFVSDPVRTNLLARAHTRRVVVWTCPTGELIRRLAPFWRIKSESRILNPPRADAPEPEEVPDLDRDLRDWHSAWRGEDDPEGLPEERQGRLLSRILRTESPWYRETAGLSDEPPASEDAERPARSGRKRDAFHRWRLELLRVTGERYRARRLNLPEPPVPGHLREPPFRRPRSAETPKAVTRKGNGGADSRDLGDLPEFDKQIYRYYIGSNGKRRSVPEIARQFGIGELNVQRALDRVEHYLDG